MLDAVTFNQKLHSNRHYSRFKAQLSRCNKEPTGKLKGDQIALCRLQRCQHNAMSMLLLTLYHLLAQIVMYLQCTGCVEAVRGHSSTPKMFAPNIIC